MKRQYNSAVGRYNAEGYEKPQRHGHFMVGVEGLNSVDGHRFPTHKSALRRATELAAIYPKADVFIYRAESYVRHNGVTEHITSGVIGGEPIRLRDYQLDLGGD